jgi:tRNA pseudouridine55 synthase
VTRPADGAPPTGGATDGVILYDKPAGITSHDVVANVRRRLGRGVKVGHAGTLDPFATGLLLVLVGRATRAQRFLMELRKTYEVVARFGWVSSTGDVDGVLTETGVVPGGELGLPTGTIRQRPPAYSAVKIGGRRAYALARAGAEVTPAEREVDVYRFEERWRRGDRRGFVIECASGTYVRSLIGELGDAYCLELRRTRIGPFGVLEASDATIVPLPSALGFIPAIVLSGEEARRAAHGVPVSAERAMRDVPAPGGEGPAGAVRATAGGSSRPVVRLMDERGLISLAQLDPKSGTLRTIVGFRG